MSPLSLVPVVIVLSGPSPAPAPQTARPEAAGHSWTYYGLEGGGPTIGYNPWVFPTHKKKSHHPAVASYEPVPGVVSVRGHHMVPPAHRGIGYSWLGYRTPSPRPKLLSVSVFPSTSPR